MVLAQRHSISANDSTPSPDHFVTLSSSSLNQSCSSTTTTPEWLQDEQLYCLTSFTSCSSGLLLLKFRSILWRKALVKCTELCVAVHCPCSHSCGQTAHTETPGSCVQVWADTVRLCDESLDDTAHVSHHWEELQDGNFKPHLCLPSLRLFQELEKTATAQAKAEAAWLNTSSRLACSSESSRHCTKKLHNRICLSSPAWNSLWQILEAAGVLGPQGSTTGMVIGPVILLWSSVGCGGQHRKKDLRVIPALGRYCKISV